MAFRPHRFGRYIIVDPIAVGGMAEIYRARLATAKDAKEGGPDRVIIIKKVIANLSQNSEFTQMFEEEIKITVGLTHPNIIQIYDYGKVEEQYFMAMEYVEGKNLRQFVKRLADMKSMFSIDMSCHIISQVCHALSYAHAYKDRLTGKPLGIVHRDISPQNVMISYDGAVKLFDFGIAKAKSASEATRAGVIKGKPSYLSPEQINGEELDGRCDIFALGIVLWELLTAKRLFVADTDMGVLRLIQSAKIEPPSTFNPAVPQALDAIVLKSLTRDKVKRYQHGEEFQRDLHKFLYSFNASFNPADLSYYAQELFKTEIREDRERLTKFLSMPPIDESRDASHSDELVNKKNLSTKLADGLMSATDFNREMMDLVVKESTGKTNAPLQLATTMGMKKPATVQVPPAGAGRPPIPGASSSSPPTVGAAPVKQAAARAQVGNKSTSNMVIPPWSKNAGSSSGIPRAGTGTASALHRELSEGSGINKNVPILVVVFAVLGIFGARQYDLLDGTPLAFLSAKKQSPKIEVVAESPAPVRSPAEKSAPVESNEPRPSGPTATELRPNQGLIILQSSVGNFQVYMNNQPVIVSNNQFPAPLNLDLRIEVRKFGYEPVRFQTRLSAQQPSAYRLEFKPLPTGALNFVTSPVDANLQFFLNGEKVYEGRSPTRGVAFPAGAYKVKIENNLINYHGEADVVIEVGKITQIEKVLK